MWIYYHWFSSSYIGLVPGPSPNNSGRWRRQMFAHLFPFFYLLNKSRGNKLCFPSRLSYIHPNLPNNPKTLFFCERPLTPLVGVNVHLFRNNNSSAKPFSCLPFVRNPPSLQKCWHICFLMHFTWFSYYFVFIRQRLEMTPCLLLPSPETALPSSLDHSLAHYFSGFEQMSRFWAIEQVVLHRSSSRCDACLWV